LKHRKPFLTFLLIVLPVLVVASVGAASTFTRIRDDLAQQRAAIASQWTEVNAVLEERASLIDQLAQRTVHGNPELLHEAHQARSALLSATAPQARIRANTRLDAVHAQLMLLMDTRRRGRGVYNTSHLGELIKDADARIAVSRRKYNETLEHYNARIQKFPQNLVARISGFSRNDAYFYTEPF
jgi:LemA protein